MTPENELADIDYLISRLEETLDKQGEYTGEHCQTPTVSYCFECDKIGVDVWCPDGCVEHRTVSSDGYEHDGIGASLVTLREIK